MRAAAATAVGLERTLHWGLSIRSSTRPRETRIVADPEKAVKCGRFASLPAEGKTSREFSTPVEKPVEIQGFSAA